MYGLDVLVQKVLLMGALVIIGFIMRKCNKLGGSVAKSFGDGVIYIAQPAMIIYSFLDVDFNTRTLITASVVFGLSLIFHLVYFLIAFSLYKNAPDKQKTVLRFATIFTNAGFMGIPLISELISP
ncbi:MAG: AEC family transporter, partial [Clostridia bacterium]|nr:AEC family transporter [Clostridia bacterium]